MSNSISPAFEPADGHAAQAPGSHAHQHVDQIAHGGEGLAQLERRVAAFGAGAGESALTQRRHMDLARQAARSLRAAADACARGEPVDLAAIDVQAALSALGRVTGEQVDDQLIDDIFSRFCVGK